MTDFSDLRRRASQHSKSGNYWAGKCLMLLDLLAAEDVPEPYRHLVAACRSLEDDLRDDRNPADTEWRIFAALRAIDALKDTA